MRLRRQLESLGVATMELDAIEATARDEIEAAAQEALEAPLADAGQVKEHLYA